MYKSEQNLFNLSQEIQELIAKSEDGCAIVEIAEYVKNREAQARLEMICFKPANLN